MSKKIQLIVGSTRKNRVATHITPWVEAQIAKNSDIELEVIDLNDWKLPFMDAAISPMYAAIDTPEAKAWAAKIAEADGYIFLTAEYNRSVPAPLKNALDTLYAEWKEKPAAIVSYGYIDGGQSATRHLTDILNWFKMRVATPAVALALSQEIVGDAGIKDIDTAFAANEADLQSALAELVA